VTWCTWACTVQYSMLVCSDNKLTCMLYQGCIELNHIRLPTHQLQVDGVDCTKTQRV
jgi:hypothetical protein